MADIPIAYLITFRCYGTWLHGDERGSMDRRRRNVYGSDPIAPDGRREGLSRDLMASPPMELDAAAREVVERAVRDTCLARSWELLALAVRTEHVHAVVTAAGSPEAVMSSLKSWCTRRLREAGLVDVAARVWSRHGSTRYLWDQGAVDGACDYVEHGQGDPLR